MASVTYTAKRQLVTGHVVGTDYKLDLRLRSAAFGGEVLRNSTKAIDGTTERIYLGFKRQWDCLTTPVSPELQPALEEFLRSTEDGHAFTFDPHGSQIKPVSPVSVFRTDTAFSKERVLLVGGGGGNDWFRYAFGVREI